MKKRMLKYGNRLARSRKVIAGVTATVLGTASSFAQGFDPTAATQGGADTAISLAGIVATAGVTIVLAFMAIKFIRKA